MGFGPTAVALSGTPSTTLGTPSGVSTWGASSKIPTWGDTVDDLGGRPGSFDLEVEVRAWAGLGRGAVVYVGGWHPITDP
jgi:hypothetical protein